MESEAHVQGGEKGPTQVNQEELQRNVQLISHISDKVGEHH